MGFDNTNRGVLFRNDKQGVESRPDYKGSVNVDGVEFWFSGWIKTAGPNAKNPGSKYLSVSVERKDDRCQPSGLSGLSGGPSELDFDDIPF